MSVEEFRNFPKNPHGSVLRKPARLDPILQKFADRTPEDYNFLRDFTFHIVARAYVIYGNDEEFRSLMREIANSAPLAHDKRSSFNDFITSSHQLVERRIEVNFRTMFTDQANHLFADLGSKVKCKGMKHFNTEGITACASKFGLETAAFHYLNGLSGIVLLLLDYFDLEGDDEKNIIMKKEECGEGFKFYCLKEFIQKIPELGILLKICRQEFGYFFNLYSRANYVIIFSLFVMLRFRRKVAKLDKQKEEEKHVLFDIKNIELK